MAASDITLLLRRPGYARYFVVVAIARATGTMFNVAGVLLVLQRTGSVVLAGVTVAAGTLPGAISGPFLGAWLDTTSSRRRLLVLDRVLTAAALVAILLAAGHAPNWVIPLIAVGFGVTSPLSDGAYSSLLPEIAGPQLLDVANTFEASSINIAFIIGPALAGLIAALAGAAIAIEVQAAAGLALIAPIAADPIYELRPATVQEPARLLEAVSEGLQTLLRVAPLRKHVIGSVLAVTGWGTLIVGFPLYAQSVHAAASASGYLWASLSFASMVSAFLFRKPALRLAPNRLIFWSCLAMGLSVLAWPTVDSLTGALVLVAVTGLLEGPSLVALVGVRQRLVPPHLRGQVFSTIFSLDIAAVAIGSALAGPLHEAAGTTTTLLTFAVLIAVAGVVQLSVGNTAAQPGVEAA